MKVARHVAVLGAGIMGSTAALWLARRGVRVTLFDAAQRPWCGASRWNEGKIHLGHLYAADPSLQTARRLLPGGLQFRPLVESLIGTSLHEATTGHDDTYLTHRDSVVDADAMAAYLRTVTELAAEHPDAHAYLTDLHGAGMRQLDRRELEAAYDTRDVVAGFRVPERSVDTQWLADRFVEALLAEPHIELRMGSRVTAVQRAADDTEGPLRVIAGDSGDGPFDAVVNALWEGRLAVDASLGCPVPAIRTHRYRLSAFVRTRASSDIPSTVIATGPFGDVKRYSPTQLYLSWYPAGLAAEGGAIAPPPAPALGDDARARIVGDLLERLGAIVPAIRRIDPAVDDVQLQGGWVYAVGHGSLADEKSDLHRRDRIGIHRNGSYFSVDTGKYSIAPWLALQVVDAISPRS